MKEERMSMRKIWEGVDVQTTKGVISIPDLAELIKLINDENARDEDLDELPNTKRLYSTGK
jgi:hypothetical protein